MGSFTTERIESEWYRRMWYFILNILLLESCFGALCCSIIPPNGYLVVLGLMVLTIIPGWVMSLFMVDLSKTLIVDQSRLIVYKIGTISRKAYLSSFKNLLIQKTSGELFFPVRLESRNSSLFVRYYISDPEQYAKFLSSFGTIDVEQTIGEVINKNNLIPDSLTIKDVKSFGKKLQEFFPFETDVRFNLGFFETS